MVPAINLAVQPPLGKDEEARILKLIGNLAHLEKPDFGLSPTLSGNAFAPSRKAGDAGAFLLTNHQIEGSEKISKNW